MLFFLINRRLFDGQYYRQHAQDLGWYRFVPLLHYLKAGWREGRNPHILFANDWYLKRYLADAPQNPLIHYIRSGWRDGCDPNPLFSTRFFLQHYAALLRPGQSPLALYLARWQQASRINAFFDSKVLAGPGAASLQASAPPPLAACLTSPESTLFQPFPFFDPDYYREYNPAAAREWPVLLRHYFEYGATEGSRPNALFDPDFYRRTYLDADTSFLDTFLHYVDSGAALGNRPNQFFEPDFYLNQMAEEERSQKGQALMHYLEQGCGLGLYPCSEVARLERKPVISILTPVYNTEANQLWRCVHSVLVQPYPHWQLCLVDDGSSAVHIRPLLEAYGQMDSRIRVAFLEENSGIATATNRAAELASGAYLAFLDHDDELAHDALYQLALAINEQDADVMYSDESLVNLESRHLDTLYKCALNRELLYSHNHLMHFFVTRRELFTAVGGLDSECDGAQDYDLALKLAEKTNKVLHIPQVLYHWRAHATSSSIHHEQKHYADEAGRRALAAALNRQQIEAAAETTDLRFFYRARRNLPQSGLVSVLVDGICGDDACAGVAFPPWCDQLVASWPWLEWLSLEGFIEDGVERRPHVQRNLAAQEAQGEYLFFIDAGIRSLRPENLPALLEYAQDASVAMVGGWLEQPENAHRHRGSIPDIANTSPLYYASFLRDVSVHHNRFHCAQYSWAVAEQLCLIRRGLFLEAGGYDSAYQTLTFAHLDLCFRLYGQGLHLVYTPYAAAVMGETRLPSAVQQVVAAQDRSIFQQRWQALLHAGNPWYNRGMLAKEDVDPAAFAVWMSGTP
ncbi:MAG: glycosyltransferase [Desulfobulbaceae bacterium]|nr:glycosyltransferase [Desulfobulbaceae bacterium]